MSEGKVRRAILGASASSIVGAVLLLVAACVLMAVGCPVTEKQPCCQIILTFAVIEYAFLLYHALRVSEGISFYSLILLASFPFFFGYQLLGAFDLESTRIYFFTHRVMPVDTLWSSSFFIAVSLLVLQGGYALFAKKQVRPHRSVEPVETPSFLALRKACLIALVVLSLPTLIYLYQNIQLTNEAGYGVRISDPSLHRSGISNIAGVLAAVMPYALLGSFMTRRKGEKWQLLATLTYCALYMLQGSRTDIFVLLLAFVYVWYLCYSKKSLLESLAQIGALLLVAACLFSIGSFTRSGGTEGVEGGNVLVEAVSEAAQTYYVTATVIDKVPEDVAPAYGETYLAGLLYILPNGLTGNYYASSESVDEVFSPYLTSYGGVGSSFIAEGYYNFGPVSLVLFFAYGVLIAVLQNVTESAFRKGAYGSFFACCGSFMMMSFFIRSDVRTFPRYFIWNIAPLIVLHQVVEALGSEKRVSRGSDVRAKRMFVARIRRSQ